jgi:hypothetical protein
MKKAGMEYFFISLLFCSELFGQIGQGDIHRNNLKSIGKDNLIIHHFQNSALITFYEHPNFTITSATVDLTKTPNEVKIGIGQASGFSVGDTILLYGVHSLIVDNDDMAYKLWKVTSTNDTSFNLNFPINVDDGEDVYIDVPAGIPAYCVDFSKLLVANHTGTAPSVTTRLINKTERLACSDSLIVGGSTVQNLIQGYPNFNDLRYHKDSYCIGSDNYLVFSSGFATYVAGKDRFYLTSTITSGVDAGIIELNPHTMKSSIVIPLANIKTGSLCSDGTYLYLVIYNNPTTLYKYSLADYSLVNSVTFTGKTSGHEIEYDGTNLYVTGVNTKADTSTSWLAKVNPSDLTYSIVITSCSPSNNLCFTTDYVYIGSEIAGLCERFLKSNLALHDKIVMDTPIFGLYSDGTYVYAGSAETSTLWRISKPNSSDIADLSIKSYSISGVSSINTILGIGTRLYFNEWGGNKIGFIEKSAFDN